MVKIFVSNIPKKLSNSEFAEVLKGSLSSVLDVALLMSSKSTNKGCAFIVVGDEEEARHLCDGDTPILLHEQRLAFKAAQDPPPPTPVAPRSSGHGAVQPVASTPRISAGARELSEARDISFSAKKRLRVEPVGPEEAVLQLLANHKYLKKDKDGNIALIFPPGYI